MNKKKNYGLISTIFFLLIFTATALAQLPIKPGEPVHKLPPPPIERKEPPKVIEPPYGPYCRGDIEVVLPVTIRYPGRYREETITLNQYQQAVVQIPETYIDGAGKVPIKVTFKLKNKTNKHFRFNVWINYDGRGSGSQMITFRPLEQKNLELDIKVHNTNGQYRSFIIGGPREECGGDDTLTSFFFAKIGVFIIIL